MLSLHTNTERSTGTSAAAKEGLQVLDSRSEKECCLRLPQPLEQGRNPANGQALLDLKRSEDHGLLGAYRRRLCTPWGWCLCGSWQGCLGHDPTVLSCWSNHWLTWLGFNSSKLWWALSPALRRNSLGCGLPIAVLAPAVPGRIGPPGLVTTLASASATAPPTAAPQHRPKRPWLAAHAA